MKRIIRIVSLLLSVFVLLFIVSAVFYPKGSFFHVSVDDISCGNIGSMADNTVDIVVLGDSEVLCAVSPMILYNKYGYTSYVCGSSDQDCILSLLSLRRAYRHQTPKIVVLETNCFFSRLNFGAGVKDLIKQTFPLMICHDRWKDLTFSDFTGVFSKQNDDLLKGFSVTREMQPYTGGDYMTPTSDVAGVSQVRMRVIRQIAELCRSHGSKLLLISTPSPSNYTYAKHNAIAAFAAQYSADYIDYNLMLGDIAIDWATDTRDSGDHVNYFGAMKVSDYLAYYIYLHYDLADHRDDSAYSVWNDDNVRYDKMVNGS